MRFGVEFGAKLLARAAHARPGRVSGLGHEAVDHAVEYDAVVEALTREFLDAYDMIGGEVGPHRDRNAALGRFDDERVFGFCHVGDPPYRPRAIPRSSPS